MEFYELLAKMQEFDKAKAEAPAEVQTDEGCGDPMPGPMAPPEAPKEEPTMNVNITAKGDAIEDILKLMTKVNPDMDKPDMPDMSPDSKIGQAIMMPKPINKLLPDFDGDNDDMPGGEKDIKITALDKDGDDEKKDKEEAWANEPDEDTRDVSYVTTKLQGGMNRRKGTHPKVAGGDNPMQKVGETNEELVSSIKAELIKALEETKGAK
jgi:hypothetical protein